MITKLMIVEKGLNTSPPIAVNVPEFSSFNLTYSLRRGRFMLPLENHFLTKKLGTINWYKVERLVLTGTSAFCKFSFEPFTHVAQKYLFVACIGYEPSGQRYDRHSVNQTVRSP